MLKEDHKEIAVGKKKDDEGYMARSELDTIERQIKNLRKVIKSSNTQLPAWVQSKITKAADYIDTAAEYLQSDEEIDENLSFSINPDQHKKEFKKNKISRTLLDKPGTEGEGQAAKNITQKLGGTGAQWKKPKLTEKITLVQKILGEEKCGKGMYWCNTDKVCKPLPNGFNIAGQKKRPTEVGIGKKVDESCTHTKKGKSCPVHGMNKCPISEEKDPKGPTQSYKSPEELAKKHGVSLKEIQNQVEIGTKVEFEHTSDKRLARITALQHLDELPNYYSKLKKMETQKESSIVRDANGNHYAEFIDIVKAGSIEEENPRWKRNIVSEATRIPSQSGNNVSVTLSWRGSYYTIQMFFPQVRVPSRIEIFDEIQKIYPGSRVVTYRVSEFKEGEPLIYAYRGGNPGKIGSNKNYVKPMGEEVEITEIKKLIDEDWQKVNRKDKTDGLSQKAVDAYRRENPGSKLKTAVTEKNPTGKRSKRRKSFCRRMKGMKSKLTSTKTARDPDSKINKALRRWRCN